MKEFLKMTGATVVGLVLFFVLIGILSVMSIVGMVASTESTKSIGNNSVLVFNLSGNLTERSESDLFSKLQSNVSSIGLDEVLIAINKAKDNEKICFFAGY